MSAQSATTALALDSALALGIAATAMPFARTPEDEAERWLRILRLHGQAGIALQSLGVSEGPLPGAGDERRTTTGRRGGGDSGAWSGVGGEASVAGTPGGQAEPAAEQDVVAQVTAHAAELAGRRGAASLDTRDLLAAVIEHYGEHFDRVLRAHGTDSDEVLDRLAAFYA